MVVCDEKCGFVSELSNITTTNTTTTTIAAFTTICNTITALLLLLLQLLQLLLLLLLVLLLLRPSVILIKVNSTECDVLWYSACHYLTGTTEAELAGNKEGILSHRVV